MSNQLQRLTRLAEILGRDRRYKLEAYLFVIEALHYELKRLGVDSPDKRRHLTARELLEGIRALGWERYGRLAKDVFENWGVHSSADFGEIVFNLIEAGEFTKTEFTPRGRRTLAVRTAIEVTSSSTNRIGPSPRARRRRSSSEARYPCRAACQEVLGRV